MATNTSPKFENAPYVKSNSYTNSDSANTKKDLVPAADVPTEGLRIDEISLTSTETANARVLYFYDHDGSTKSYRFTREHAHELAPIDFVPLRKEIATPDGAPATWVEMHDGSVVRFRADTPLATI